MKGRSVNVAAGHAEQPLLKRKGNFWGASMPAPLPLMPPLVRLGQAQDLMWCAGWISRTMTDLSPQNARLAVVRLGWEDWLPMAACQAYNALLGCGYSRARAHILLRAGPDSATVLNAVTLHALSD